MSDFALSVVSNVLVAVSIAAVATLVGLRNRNCVIAHTLWLAVLIKLVTPPLIELPLPIPAAVYDRIVADSFFNSPFSGKQLSSPHIPSEDILVDPLLVGESSSAQLPTQVERPAKLGRQFWLVWLAWAGVTIWIVGAVGLLVRGSMRFAQFAHLIRYQARIDDAASAELQSLGDALPQRRGFLSRALPPVVEVPADIAPMLFGIGHWTAIVCPEKLWQRLSPVRRRAFMAHELAHFLRGDHWVRWLEWFVSSVYWWLPLCYWARRQLERSEELACDSWVVSTFAVRKRDYAETLLQVVDYLDISQQATQRLATRMQATDLLEQRVKQILSTNPTQPVQRWLSWSMIGVAFGLLLAHPLPYRYVLARSSGKSATLSAAMPSGPVVVDDGSDSSRLGELDLPTEPWGWWNEAPESQWADILFRESGVRIVATSGHGIQVHNAEGLRVGFDVETSNSQTFTMTGCVELPGSHRFIVADASGALRVWDWEVGLPVSLIGKHSARLSSVAFHPVSGLVAADVQGSVIRWDHVSGSPSATWTSPSGPIQSVRWSHDGQCLAVLMGDWQRVEFQRQLLMIDAGKMQVQQTQMLPNSVAVVWDDPHFGWIMIDWLGTIRSLSGETLYKVAKPWVSALVLSPDAATQLDLSRLNSAKEQTH